jgi:DNA polymerase-3 subunit delta'
MRGFETLCPWLFEPLETLERAARAKRLGHGWLIGGPLDTGKRNLAYVLAERLLRDEIGRSVPKIAKPREILAAYDRFSSSVDLHADLFRLRAEEDKSTISVDQVREMTANLTLKPLIAGLKVLVIESAETMTTSAANALLKSLEEPTPNTYLFLLAERPGRLPATIRSRCQKIVLHPPTGDAVIEWLESDGLREVHAPPSLLTRAPLTVARALIDTDYLINYNDLYSDIKSLYEGSSDPHAIAERWKNDDPELGLTCLIESLQDKIRRRLGAGRWNPVTDSGAQLADNSVSGISTEALFEGLKRAEQLREQLGRGTNVALALRALLVGLDQSKVSRVNL